MNKVVYIVDDDDAIRDSLALLLKSEGYQTRSCANAESFLAKFDDTEQAIVLLDIAMPGISGLALQQYLLEKKIYIPIIFLTGHGDVTTAVNAMKAGACDFIEKPFDNNVLLKRISKCFLIKAKLDQAVQEKTDNKRKLSLLTHRESQVLDKMIDGKQNKVIGAELGISTRTVEIHRANIMHKLNARSLSDVVRIAIRH
jgi:FixJ family two-component response regulator